MNLDSSPRVSWVLFCVEFGVWSFCLGFVQVHQVSSTVQNMQVRQDALFNIDGEHEHDFLKLHIGGVFLPFMNGK